MAASSALTMFWADFGPIRSRPVSLPAVRVKRSAGVWTYSFSTNWSIILSPIPSTSIARRETKCFRDSLRCAPQINPPVQRVTASPSTRSTSEPHTGQWAGNSMARVSAGRSDSTTLTTCGITSPARRITTLSPFAAPDAQFHRRYAAWRYLPARQPPAQAPDAPQA